MHRVSWGQLARNLVPPKQCGTQKVSSKAGSTLDPTMVGWCWSRLVDSMPCKIQSRRDSSVSRTRGLTLL